MARQALERLPATGRRSNTSDTLSVRCVDVDNAGRAAHAAGDVAIDLAWCDPHPAAVTPRARPRVLALSLKAEHGSTAHDAAPVTVDVPTYPKGSTQERFLVRPTGGPMKHSCR
jgi:hypothetical protein